MVEELDTTSLNSDNENEWNSQIQCSNQNESITLQQNNEEHLPTFGNLSVTNSNDVHFGNKTFYQGPVTIQQFLYGEDKFKKINETDITKSASNAAETTNIPKNFENGIDNPGCDVNLATRNGDINRNFESKQENVDVVNTNKDCNVNFFSSRCLIILKVILIIIISCLIILFVFLIGARKTVLINDTHIDANNGKISDEHEHNTPIEAPTDPVNSLKPMKLKIVSRLEWLAQPATHELDPLKTPVPYVIISHTATENCSSQAQCVFQVRYIQTFHMESRGWWDIGYNFLVGGDGEVYYGRGWNKEGSHTYGYNSKSIGISFIGTFINSKPPDYQLIACQNLIAKGVELGYIKEDYKLVGARQLQTTQSPGNELFKEIQTWPHWAKKI